MKTCRLPKYSLKYLLVIVVALIGLPNAGFAQSDEVYLRFKVIEPDSNRLRVTLTGYRKKSPWRFPAKRFETVSGRWSRWISLSDWKWHGKLRRSGGVSEFPTLTLRVASLEKKKKIHGCKFAVEISDRPDGTGFAKSFTEESTENSIIFLVPYPLRQHLSEFETGNQAAKRHAKWAREATGGRPPVVKRFPIVTSLTLQNHPDLADKEVDTLVSLGFNTVGGVPSAVMRKYKLSSFTGIWALDPDPDVAKKIWERRYLKRFQRSLTNEDDRFKFSKISYFAISDEVRVLNFRRANRLKLDGWFRDYLRQTTGSNNFFGRAFSSIDYPLEKLTANRLDRNAPLDEKRVLYHAAKFGQFWSAKQIKQSANEIKQTFPAAKTSTLLPSHGFFGNAWGRQYIGMGYRMLDIFELGRQHAVEQLSAEDWLGLNYTYGYKYTWSGAQSFGYFNAVIRSATPKNISLQGLITPSDDKYLRLKAYSSLGQGAKSLFFWSYGPTMTATENYWSDLRSEYDGIVKINRAIEKTEDVLLAAETATDDVAIMYSVSHDIWNTDRQSPFVEKRLLWHGLRHLQIQPEFVDEKIVSEGGLAPFKALFVTDTAISRAATAKIDAWVRNGGVLYLSSGAATEDEYSESYLPPFARAVWKEGTVVFQRGTFNERSTLKKAKPLTSVNIKIDRQRFDLPVLGGSTHVNEGGGVFARFPNGVPAGRVIKYGRGKIIAVGFMPMIAYGQAAKFVPRELGEKWTPEPRRVIEKTLKIADIEPVAEANVPVVETNLLEGREGLALVLVNYTYEPIKKLEVAIRTSRRITKAVSSEGKRVKIVRRKRGKVIIRLPLDWTDIVILK